MALGFEWSDETVWDAGALARPGGPLDVPMVLVSSGVNAFSEQLVISAFVVTALRKLTGSTIAGVAVATGLFASYHVYQGFWGVVSVVIFGLLVTSLFTATGRLWPCFIAHFLGDAVPFLLAIEG